jgi:hypothetical protein
MADYNSSLPVRTETNGDVAVKIVDGTLTSQALGVDSNGKVTVKLNDGSGNALTSTGGDLDVNITTADVDIRDLTHVSDSVKVGDGTDLLAVNADGSINITDNGGSLTVDATDLDIRDLTHVSDSTKIGDGTDLLAINADGSVNITDNGGSLTVDATDLDIRDLTHASDSVKIGDGTDLLAVNADGSINVVLQGNPQGTELCNYQTSAAVAGGGTATHDYTVTASTTLYLDSIFCSASGKMKAVVQAETAPASAVYNTKFVGFNSTANPNVHFEPKAKLSQVAGAKIRILLTNNENQAQDLYSTLVGSEIA